MARNPQIVVEYVAKTASLDAAATKVGTTSARAGAAARKAFVPAVAALGALGVASKKAVDAASGLNEQIAASQVVFGKSAKSVQDWGKTGAQAFGLSQKEALAAANAYGNMFNTVGLGNKEVTGMSKSMVQLAGDMASFHDQDPTDMLDALRSGLSGEAEPLKKFGVLMTEATVKAAAYREGIAKNGAELTEGQKVQARYALIMEQTGKAQGDFARTSESVANQQRTLKAETENTTAAFGQALLPAMQALQKIAGGLIGLFGGNVKALTAFIGVVAGVAAAIVTINAAMSAWAAISKVLAIQIKGVTVAQMALNAATAISPIGLVVIAVVALAAAFALAYKHSEKFRELVDAAFSAIAAAASAVFDWFKANWPLLLAIMSGPFALFGAAIAKNWETVQSGIKTATAKIKSVAINLGKGIIDGVKAGVAGLAAWVGGRMSDTVDKVADWINNAYNKAKSFGTNIFNGIKEGVTGIAADIGTRMSNIVAKIEEWINNAYNKGKSLGTNIFNGIVDGITGIAEKVASMAQGAINAVKTTLKGFTMGPIKVLGKTVIPKLRPFAFLAEGGIVTRPTMAMIGEAGPEAVIPLTGGGGNAPIQVRVFIGDTELRGIVRTEVVDQNTGIARTLLAGVHWMPPVLTVEPGVQNVRIDVTVPAGKDRLTVTRHGPSGESTAVRGWQDATVVPGLVTVRDFEAPIGVPVTYTTDTWDDPGGAHTLESATITITGAGCDDTWLTDLVRAGNTQQVVLERLEELAYPVPTSVHSIIGRRTPIISGDVAHTPSFELAFLTDTLDERDQARAALGNGVPVLLRTPPENGIGNLYMAVTGFAEQRIVSTATEQARRFVVAAVQVERPDPDLYVPLAPITYAYVKTTYATYTILKAQRASYDALAYDWAGTDPSDIIPWPPSDL